MKNSAISYKRHRFHLDEVVVSIAGRKHWLWRAVDQDGYVLDELEAETVSP